MELQPFHLAMPVDDLEQARVFYSSILGCEEGRSSEKWIDFNFFGHQFVVHLDESEKSVAARKRPANSVDGHQVPVPHFGVILEWGNWQQLVDTLRQKKIQFVIEPYIRFEGEIGEQATLFLNDPAGNALEFKSFRDFSQIFVS